MVRTIVIYIDIDDDIGELGFSTPVIGEEKCKVVIDKASTMIPTDSDFNSMVVAYNVYKSLKNKGEDAEIVFITGSKQGGLEAQIEFSRKLDEIISELMPQNAVVVYDSPEDASVIPIIQSRLKILATQQVIVEQYRGVEETYALLSKYIKKALTEERYARIFLGVPGVILALAGILSALNLSVYIEPAVLIILGAAMVLKGLKIDEAIENWWENSTIMVISATISIVGILIGFINLYFQLQFNKFSLPVIEAAFIILQLLPYVTFSAIVLFGGKAISKALERDIKVWHDIIRIINIIFIYFVLFKVINSIINDKYYLITQSLYTLIIASIGIISVYITLNTLERHGILERVIKNN
ncbi:hypothetical protein BFU36_01695 [Sulfolobus sp. A20]|uniref:DUF373 family protein n=1 Tax=Sulfolobaceae TaxID=118883 RepID=UPI00084605F3|nr:MULTISPECIES: DUF373 family protein [unclassified Sulfolobus]TRM78168.1 DUF373 domain-containing protein [Sulfolobus sp. A20-N-F8]TRM79383.1 DUF373 domain-containing protein [Sulfolobus sp. B5]TRM84143.1 DUF373 domain-containing protein [Sulfolobus sp. A20-N-F6]TRM86386.1 DUF373 domain-containing protein [Sulfolobus sp. E3]TRM88831.1 DUF373 domain-containing protein [Sulfolobus sp. C3]TRM98618.1 DUF373 domain-containing protein [Sulfolobus sp. E1]